MGLGGLLETVARYLLLAQRPGGAARERLLPGERSNRLRVLSMVDLTHITLPVDDEWLEGILDAVVESTRAMCRAGHMRVVEFFNAPLISFADPRGAYLS